MSFSSSRLRLPKPDAHFKTDGIASRYVIVDLSSGAKRDAGISLATPTRGRFRKKSRLPTASRAEMRRPFRRAFASKFRSSTGLRRLPDRA